MSNPMRKWCGNLWVLLLFAAIRSGATGDSTHYVLPTDTLVLELDFAGELSFNHQLEPKQTLYGLSRHYGMPVTELYAYNPGISPESVSVKDAIRIPVPNKVIVLETPAKWLLKRYVPIQFQVKQGDTVYGICNRYFPGLAMDTLRQRNALTSDGLSHGTRLLIGWLSIDGVPKDMRVEMGPGGRQNYLYKLAYYRNLAGKHEVSERGAATWDKGTEEGGLYALHRTAPVGSYLKIYNPMSKVTLYLKVIGKMPETVYDSETKVFLSPRAARLLNGRDRRFYVRLSYY